MFKKTVGFILLILMSLSIKISAQIRVSDIDLYTIADGLSQSFINVIFQDSRGFIWLGTKDGLNRFDGNEFVSYSHQPNDSNTISNNYINAICEDNKGSLWIATNYGLNNLDLKTGKIITYLNNPQKNYTISDNQILNVYIDKQNTLWVKTLKSLDRFNAEKQTFTRNFHFNDVFYYSSNNISFPIIEDNAHQLWVGTKDGLNYFDRDLQLFNRYISLDFNKNSISNNEVRSIAIAKNGNLWIGTSFGLNEFNPVSRIFKRHYIDDFPLSSSNNNKFNSLIFDNNNTLWVGTNGGLFYLDMGTGKFLKPVSDNNEYLFDYPVYSLSIDNSGLLWIGTYKGLLKLNLKPHKFQLFNNKLTGIELPSFDIGSIFTYDSNSILIGTLGKGLSIYNSKFQITHNYSFATKGDDRNDFINCILKYSDGNYILGTNNGIIIFNPITGDFKNINDLSNIKGSEILIQNKVNALIEDKYKKIWIGASYGFYGYKPGDDFITICLNNPDDNNSIVSNKINTLTQDKGGIIWIGTENGLDSFDPDKNTFSHYKKDSKGKDLFSSQNIYCQKFDNKGLLWVGTASGLNCLNIADKTVTMYSEKNGLSDNSIYSIEITPKNEIWVSTNRGLNKIIPEKSIIINYDSKDGLQDYEFNINSSCQSRNGDFYFGGVSGFNIFNPNAMTNNLFIPPVEITSIEIITAEGKSEIRSFQKDIITIPHKAKVLTINFAALDFTVPGKNRYAYKIYSVNEKEPSWIYIGRKHSATFSGLKPGEYIFKIKGSNNDDIWNEKGATIAILVESPIWLKPSAIYIYIFVGIIILLAMYRYRTYNLRQTNRILKEKEIASIEIERQKEQLALKNKNITDSINYAKRIQEALMPSEKSIKRILPESFVFHRPKDIVSGDFFWVSERGDKIFVAAVDCTGHGVPGAFMSIIGFELFRKITHNQGIENPSQILSILNKEFEEIFNDVSSNYVLRDGMDIAFCVIDKKTKLLEYSGAVNPIYLIRDDKITEILGSRFSVGLDNTPEIDRGFENKQIILQDDDVIYLFSDGFADQFGGPEGKKFKYRRFRHLLLTIHKYPMDEQHDLLLEKINRWKGDFDQVDDMLIIGFKPNFG
jgi:ligand-binding sensor domain-containing protein/serine phosphatase RsbU (regulator of sigma subunit)